MIRRLGDRIGNYMSANHPVLWAVRLDMAVLLSVALFVAGLVMIYIARTILDTYLGEARSSEAGATCAVAQSLLFISVLILWIISIRRSHYRAASPRMQGYPRILDYSIGLFFPIVSIAYLIILTFHIFDKTVQVNAEILFLLFLACIGTSSIVAPIFYVIFHKSFKFMIIGYLISLAVFGSGLVIATNFTSISFVFSNGNTDKDGVLGFVTFLWIMAALVFLLPKRMHATAGYATYGLIFLTPFPVIYVFITIGGHVEIDAALPNEIAAKAIKAIIVISYFAANNVVMHLLSRRLARMKLFPA